MGAMSFDFGMSHIGVATIDIGMRCISPTAVVKAKKGKPNTDQLDFLVNTWQPTELVVGLPLNMDDSESPMSVASRKFAKYLKKRFSLPVHFVDERLTTLEAKDRSESDRPSHAVAAAVIGESWLNEYIVEHRFRSKS